MVLLLLEVKKKKKRRKRRRKKRRVRRSLMMTWALDSLTNFTGVLSVNHLSSCNTLIVLGVNEISVHDTMSKKLHLHLILFKSRFGAIENALKL